MERRDFITTASAVAGAGALGSLALGQGAAKGKREYYEFRTYKISTPEKKQALLDFLEKAAVPAYNRIGVKPVAVWVEYDGKDNDVRVMLTHATLEGFATATQRLLADEEFQKAGANLLDIENKKDAAYDRIESRLMVAFSSIPRLEAPQKSAERLYELRRYESHSVKKGQSKIEMFNSAEIAVFRETGVHPVFFGEALIGPYTPNLTYMITFADMPEHDANWKKFGGHPKWQELKGMAKYKNTVSNIQRTFLRAAPCSQV